jgi:putative redox protein
VPFVLVSLAEFQVKPTSRALLVALALNEDGESREQCEPRTRRDSREETMPRKVSVASRSLKYSQTASIGPHVFNADEPNDVGGGDTGPNAQELLMASLGACANITLQIYANRHQWPLEGVQATLSYERVLAENPIDSDAKIGMVDRIEMEISFSGDLSDEQRQRLFEIAGRCPIHRMLVSPVQVEIRLVDVDMEYSHNS